MSLIESSKSLSQFDYCLTTLQLLMCQALLFALLRLRFSLPHSAGARVYSTTVALACQIRLSLLRFISSALWRFARQTRQSNCPADPHHFHDALRYKSSSYNTWTYTANPLGSVFLNVLCLSQCFRQHTLVVIANSLCARHKSVGYYYSRLRSNLEACYFI